MNVRRTILLGAALSALAVAVAGPAAAAGVEGKSICYITAANSHFYVTPTNEGAQAAADAAGVDLTIVSEEFSPQTGADQLNSCVARKVDGILLWPLDANSYLPGLLKAKQAGIPVVAIDTTAGEESMKLIASFVGADKYGQGQISAKQMNEALGGEGNIVIIAGQAGNNTTIMRTEGFLADKAEGINVLATVNADFDQQKALVVVPRPDHQVRRPDRWRLRRGRRDGGRLPAGAQRERARHQAGRPRHRRHEDGVRRDQAGEMTSTIMQPPFENGRLAIETLTKVMARRDGRRRGSAREHRRHQGQCRRLKPAF